jgi:hypothetical protein
MILQISHFPSFTLLGPILDEKSLMFANLRSKINYCCSKSPKNRPQNPKWAPLGPTGGDPGPPFGLLGISLALPWPSLGPSWSQFWWPQDPFQEVFSSNFIYFSPKSRSKNLKFVSPSPFQPHKFLTKLWYFLGRPAVVDLTCIFTVTGCRYQLSTLQTLKMTP